MWLKPLVLWAIFALGLYAVSVCIVIMVRKQWVERERLAFPLAVVPMELAEGCTSGSPVFRSPALWMGFFVALIMPLSTTLKTLYGLETMPSLTIPPQFLDFERYRMRIATLIDPLIIGLGFLISLDVLLSVWLFYILTTVEPWVLIMLGLGRGGGPYAAGGACLGAQQTGALFAIAGVSLWFARHYLRDFVRKGIRGERGEEILSEQCTLALGVVGFVLLVGFTVGMGVELKRALVFVFLALALMFGTTRYIVQTGLGRGRAPRSPAALMVSFFGSETFGAKGMASLGLGFVWAGDTHCFFMGTTVHSLKVIGEKVTDKRGIFTAMTLAAVVAITVTFLTYIGVGSKEVFLTAMGGTFKVRRGITGIGLPAR